MEGVSDGAVATERNGDDKALRQPCSVAGESPTSRGDATTRGRKAGDDG
jgi:hypothetical protein